MVSSSASSSMWQSMGGHHSSTIMIVVIVLTATVTLLLPSPASSFVVQQVPEVQPLTRTTMPMTLRSSSMRLVSSQVMSSYPTTTTTTTSLYVSRKDRYSSTIINRSPPDSTSHHHHHHTATSDTIKKGGAMEDHWSDLWQEPAASISHHQPASSASAVTIIPIQNEIDIALLQRHLIEGIIEHQTLLDSLYQHVEQPSHTNLTPQQQSSSVEGIDDALIQTTSASKSTIIPVVSDVWKARLLLLLSAALYGTNFTLVKSIDDIPGMSVGLASTFRFGFAALVMLPLLFTPLDEELTSIMTLAAEERTTQISIIVAGMEIGLYNSIGYLFQAEGLKTTTASKSAFICSMACLTVPILDYIWGKKLLRRQVIGAILAAVGVFALEMGGEQSSITNGDWESLVQPIVFGLGFWRLEAAVEKYPTETGRLASSQLVTVFLVSLLYLACPDNLSFLGGSSATGDVCNVISTGDEIISWLLDPQIVGMFFWTGIVTTAFTIYMETLALKTLSAAETTLIFSTEPLFGAAFAAIVANEVFGLPDAIGAAFIILGCVVSGMDVGSFFGGGSAANNSKT